MSERSPLLQANHKPSHTIVDADESHVSFLRGSVIAASIFVLLFLCTCNISALTTIQSPIAIDLDATTETSWFVSAFLIGISSITPIAGKLSQIFSARVYLLWSTVLSAVGLLVTAFASSLAIFLTGRAIQGVGIAAIAPVAFILVNEHASKKRRGLLFGLINCSYTSGVACGAIIGGVLEPVTGWRACFWLQVPFVLFAAVTAFFSIPKPSALSPDSNIVELSVSQKLARIDYFGIITLVSAIVLLLYSLSGPRLQMTPVILSLATMVLFVLVEAKWADDPLVPVAVLKSRGSLLTGLATVGAMTARWAILFYVPIYAIAVREWPQARAGILLIPTNVGFGLGGVVVGLLHIRRAGSYYVPSLVCFVIYSALHFTVGVLSVPHSSMTFYVVVLFFNGFAKGAALNYTLAHLLHVTEAKHHAIVIAINTMFRNLSGAFGSSVSGGIFLRALQKSLTEGFIDADRKPDEELIRQLLGRPMLVQKLQGIEKQIAISGYTYSLQRLYYFGAILVLFMLVLQASVGWTSPSGDDDQKVKSDDSESNEEVIV